LNGFTRDTYASNRVRHFELILLKNGFELTQEGEKQVLSASGMMEEINEKPSKTSRRNRRRKQTGTQAPNTNNF
jgi:hypothetical protein